MKLSAHEEWRRRMPNFLVNISLGMICRLESLEIYLCAVLNSTIGRSRIGVKLTRKK
jgi:hypothetical protein